MDFKGDIIVAMNDTLSEPNGITIPFVQNFNLEGKPLERGSVLSFGLPDGKRSLHMLICHGIGRGGWRRANRYIRFGMDWIWDTWKVESNPNQKYAIVQIGTGPIGQRDGAHVPSIISAINGSHLPVTMIIRDSGAAKWVPNEMEPLHVFRTWSPLRGETKYPVAA